jgi:hypothetical protein
MSKRIALSIAVFVLTFGLVAGYLTDNPAGDVPHAWALDCQPVNDTCIQDGTKTSALEVDHVSLVDDEISEYVEPDDGESWNITAEWRQESPCDPGDYRIETASVDVSWNGSAWVLSNETTTTNIVDIDICQGDECSGTSGDHSWNYKLIVDVNDPEDSYAYNLRDVTYTTTSVDDGYEIDFGLTHTTCDSLGDSVSPTSQSFTATDRPGKWRSTRCSFNCNIVGTSVQLTYE